MIRDRDRIAAAGATILEGGGDIDFLIIGSMPMANPAMVFGNPRPSGRVLQIAPGKPVEAIRLASKFFRDNGYQSRPTQVHSIDLVTDKPHVSAEHVSAGKFEEVLKSGMVIMAEPNPITPDGLFGIFLGHTFIVTETEHEVVDDFPPEIALAGG
jgi:hypothetical protein